MTSTPDSYFADQWTSDDPWSQEDRWYETRKFGLTVAALPAEHYRRGFEPGCGTGLLTEKLAPRVDDLLAMEREPRGVAVTRRRCDGLEVQVLQGRIPEDWPSGPFDLIVLSEVLYYLDDDELAFALDRVDDTLAPDGHVLAVHYRRRVPEHARLGDEVHDVLRSRLSSLRIDHLEDDFRLEAFTAR